MHQNEDFQINGTRALFETVRDAMLATPLATVWGANGETVTYQALLDTARLIHDRLPGLGHAGEETIAICAEKTPNCLAAVLAVLSTGRAYAPLDPTHPDARLLDILGNLATSAVIVDNSTVSRVGPWARDAGLSVINISEMPMLEFATIRHAMVGSQQNLAVVLHTSGSSGNPKRVEIEATALHLFQNWVVAELCLGRQDCLLSHAPFAFDLSFLDIFASLMSGARLVLANAKTARNGARLVALMEASQVTVWHSAPSALKLLVEAVGDRQLPYVRHVLFAGEPMPARTLQALFRIFPNAEFTNIYGCTETNDTFAYRVPRDATPDPLPLGHKLPYVDFLLVEADGTPITTEGEGELWVRCPTMMRGYSDPDLTAGATVIHHGRRYYRSGDQVRRDGEGLIHFIGRNDTIVKLSGIRVDLNEVDTILRLHPKVEEATCFVTTDGDEKTLNAWVTSKSEDMNSLELRLHLMKRLPAAAIPRNFTISLFEVPKNSNGKACRRQLAQNSQPAFA